jgi:very-short-patch-repair endonuclease
MIGSDRKHVEAARKARREMSLPEIALWAVLKTRPDGLKFRHEHPAGPYRLDFYCDKAKLCVEVDGEAHERGNRPERDERRDAWMTMHGIETMRVPARDVLSDLEAVVTMIVDRANQRKSPP